MIYGLIVSLGLLAAQQDASTVRELSIENLPAKDIEKYLDVTSFVLNSLSSKRVITRPKLTKDGKSIQFDLEDYGINPRAFDKFKGPYKKLRADWFIYNALTAPMYFDLLDIKDLKAFQKLVNYNENAPCVRAVITESKIARNNRHFLRRPTINGYYWSSYDNLSSVGAKDLLDNLLSETFDNQEIMASLPNGMNVYYMTDSASNRLDHGNPDVMIDVNNPVDKRVIVGRSCVSCHTTGLMPIDDVVRRLVASGSDVRIVSSDKDTLKKIEELYGADLEIKSDQERFARSLRKVNGLTPQENAKQFASICTTYARPLKLEEAATELGISKEDFEKICKSSGSPHLLLLLMGQTVRRDQWESMFVFLSSGLASK